MGGTGREEAPLSCARNPARVGRLGCAESLNAGHARHEEPRGGPRRRRRARGAHDPWTRSGPGAALADPRLGAGVAPASHDPHGKDAYPGEGVALAGTRVAWDDCSSCYGNTLTTRVSSATLARRSAVSLGSDDGTEVPSGGEVLAPSGDGKLLAFTDQQRCDESDENYPCPPGRQTGDVVQATIWRAAPRGHCPSSFSDGDSRRPGHCARVARANGELTVLAVDAGRIAARTDNSVRLLTGAGRRLLDVPVRNVSGAALSGNRLAVRVPDSFQIYDTGSGELLATIPAQSRDRLEDLKAGILVTANGKTITLRRLSVGHTTRLRTPGYAHARLEGPGLFVASGHRVTFVPMADIRRRLG